MADAVTATTVQDGPRKAVIYCTNTSDGTGEAAVVKVDVSALAALQDGTACTGVRIEKVTFANVGMGVKLLWASGGKTGDIQLTTVGHSSGDTYSIVLHCLKDYS